MNRRRRKKKKTQMYVEVDRNQLQTTTTKNMLSNDRTNEKKIFMLIEIVDQEKNRKVHRKFKNNEN